MTRPKTKAPTNFTDGFPLTTHPNGQWCKKIEVLLRDGSGRMSCRYGDDF